VKCNDKQGLVGKRETYRLVDELLDNSSKSVGTAATLFVALPSILSIIMTQDVHMQSIKGILAQFICWTHFNLLTMCEGENIDSGDASDPTASSHEPESLSCMNSVDWRVVINTISYIVPCKTLTITVHANMESPYQRCRHKRANIGCQQTPHHPSPHLSESRCSPC
jgi:hypothetical protein